MDGSGNAAPSSRTSLSLSRSQMCGSIEGSPHLIRVVGVVDDLPHPLPHSLPLQAVGDMVLTLR